MHNVKVTREMDSNAATIWRYLDDFGSIYKYHPGVESSEILGKKITGPGAIRQCNFYDGTSIKEKISHYDEGRSYTLELSDYAMPFKSAEAHMEVTPTSADKSKLSISLKFVPKFGPIGWLMGKLLMKPMMTKALKDLTKGLDDHIRTGQFIGSKGKLLTATQ